MSKKKNIFQDKPLNGGWKLWVPLTQDTNGFHFVNAILISQVIKPQRHFGGLKGTAPRHDKFFWSGVMKFPYILFWYVFFINESLRSSFRWNSFLWLHVSEIDILGAKSMKSGWLPLYEDEVILFWLVQPPHAKQNTCTCWCAPGVSLAHV